MVAACGNGLMVYPFASDATLGIRPTLYTMAASGAATYVPITGNYLQFERQVGEGIDPLKYNWVVVDYPGAHQIWDIEGISAILAGNVTIAQDVAVGVANCIKAIESTSGPFAFCGYSLGAFVLSLVYKQIQSGVLQYRASDFLGAVTFGNSGREQGHTIPGGTDPGGMGCFGPDYCMTNAPANWWDFAYSDPDDLFTTADPSTSTGALVIAVADLVLSNFTSQDFATFTTFLYSQLESLGTQAEVETEYNALAEFMSWNPDVNTTGHGMYADPYPGLAGNTLSAVQLGINFLNTLTSEVTVDRVGQLNLIDQAIRTGVNGEIGGSAG